MILKAIPQPSLHFFTLPPPDPSPEPRETELVRVSEVSRGERPLVLNPSPWGRDLKGSSIRKIEKKKRKQHNRKKDCVVSDGILWVLPDFS
jgi:hypothetical protein